MARLSRRLPFHRGYSANSTQGKNAELSYDSDYFIVLSSLNVHHYEKVDKGNRPGRREHQRMQKPGGVLLLMTVGSEYTIYTRANPVAPDEYQIDYYHFRNGEQYFDFDRPE